MLPRGGCHVLQGLEPANGSESREMKAAINGVVAVRSNCGPNAASLDLLCGRFNYAANALLIDVLPDLVKMSFAHGDVPTHAHRRHDAQGGERGRRPRVFHCVGSFHRVVYPVARHTLNSSRHHRLLALLAHPAWTVGDLRCWNGRRAMDDRDLAHNRPCHAPPTCGLQRPNARLPMTLLTAFACSLRGPC